MKSGVSGNFILCLSLINGENVLLKIPFDVVFRLICHSSLHLCFIISMIVIFMILLYIISNFSFSAAYFASLLALSFPSIPAFMNASLDLQLP